MPFTLKNVLLSESEFTGLKNEQNVCFFSLYKILIPITEVHSENSKIM